MAKTKVIGLLIFLLWGFLGVKVGHGEEINCPGHEGISCLKCHQADAQGHPQKALLFGGQVTRLCLSCHKEVMAHPVGVEVKNRSVLFALLDLPLGKDREITCITCHNVHPSSETPYLLRGQSYTEEEESQGDLGPEGNNYATLCAACHPESFTKKDPHPRGKEDCLYCHLVSTKRVKQDQKLKDFLNKYACTPCHQDIVCAYDPGYNPFKDPVVRKKALAQGLEVPKGRPVCGTCHTPHDTAKGHDFLRPQYLPLARSSRSINPHWKKIFCLCCHAQEPERGNPHLKNKDFNRLCQRCHDNRFARADIHPVGIKPQNVKIPPYMPLQDGKLTCETCHNALLQCYLNEESHKINPLFLRREGLPRYKFCFLCHEAKAYQRMNPHEHQIDKHGRIVKKRCLICHSSIPDVAHTKGASEVHFSVKDPDECCRGCHPGYDKYHPAGYTHVGVRPSPKIMKAIKSSVKRLGVEVPLYNGRVICASCHNPHEQGVIKFRAAATGSTRPNKLRLPATMEMCVACHADKAFKQRQGYRTWWP